MRFSIRHAGYFKMSNATGIIHMSGLRTAEYFSAVEVFVTLGVHSIAVSVLVGLVLSSCFFNGVKYNTSSFLTHSLSFVCDESILCRN